MPSNSLVEIVFGKRRFEERAGLYTIASVGDVLHLADMVRCMPLVRGLGPKPYIVGGAFGFRGYRMLLYLDREGITSIPPSLRFGPSAAGLRDDTNLSKAQLNHHTSQIRSELNRHLSHIIHFRW